MSFQRLLLWPCSFSVLLFWNSTSFWWCNAPPLQHFLYLYFFLHKAHEHVPQVQMDVSMPEWKTWLACIFLPDKPLVESFCATGNALDFPLPLLDPVEQADTWQSPEAGSCSVITAGRSLVWCGSPWTVLPPHRETHISTMLHALGARRVTTSWAGRQHSMRTWRAQKPLVVPQLPSLTKKSLVVYIQSLQVVTTGFKFALWNNYGVIGIIFQTIIKAFTWVLFILWFSIFCLVGVKYFCCTFISYCLLPAE